LRPPVLRETVLACLAICAVLPAAPAHAVEVRLVPADARVETACGGPGSLRAESEAGKAPIEVEVALGTSATVTLDPEDAWSLSGAFPGCWTPEVTLPAATGDTAPNRPLEIPVWPATEVHGRLDLPQQESRPPILHFESPPPADHGSSSPALAVPRSSTRCAREEGDADAFRCEVPATPLDVKVSLPDLAPHYLWGLEPEVGVPLGLGTLTFVAGASVAGYVTFPRGALKPEEIEVRLLPEVPDGESSATGRRLSRRGRENGVDERGFFQITGLAGGAYSLRASGEKGYASGSLDSVTVASGSERWIERPLELQPPGRLTIYLDPSSGPSATPWTVTINRELPLSRHLERVAERTTREDGSVVVEGLQPDRYVIAVADSEGNQVARESVPIPGGDHHLEIEIDRVVLHGRVHRGDAPWSGVLKWSSTDGRRLQFDPDEEGFFSGYLPAEGSWRIELGASGDRGQLFLEDWVEVWRGPDGVAVVDLTLPDTVLPGVVRDASGDPAASAFVRVSRDGRLRATLRTDDEGRFRFEGLPPGTLEVRAERHDRYSELVRRDLRSGDDDPLSLVLRSGRHLPLRVTYGGRPVAGARIRYFRSDLPVAGEVNSGLAGNIDLVLPPDVDYLDLVAVAPGLPVAILRVPVSRDGSAPRPVEIALPQSSGQLVVQLHSGAQLLYEGQVTMPWWKLILTSGSAPPRGLDLRTGRLTVDAPPGTYTWCVPTDGRPACEQGYLAAGGTLQLGPEPVESESDRPEPAAK